MALLFTNGRMVLRGTRSPCMRVLKGHGRLETRRVVATDDLAWLQKDHQWPGMRRAKVESRRELLVEGKVEEETRYYISSLPGDAKQIGQRCAATGASRMGCTG